MRRIAVAISVLAAAGLPASAHASVGAPITHGPDPAGVSAGPEAAAAAPGGLGKRGAKLGPGAWGGAETGSDDTVNEVDNGAYRYHAVYMIASDGQDRFSQLATTMQNDAFQASALLETSYGRAIRFDLGPSCGPPYLDSSVLRMPMSTAQRRAASRRRNGTFNAVTSALDA